MNLIATGHNIEKAWILIEGLEKKYPQLKFCVVMPNKVTVEIRSKLNCPLMPNEIKQVKKELKKLMERLNGEEAKC